MHNSLSLSESGITSAVVAVALTLPLHIGNHAALIWIQAQLYVGVRGFPFMTVAKRLSNSLSLSESGNTSAVAAVALTLPLHIGNHGALIWIQAQLYVGVRGFPFMTVAKRLSISLSLSGSGIAIAAAAVALTLPLCIGSHAALIWITA